MIYQGAEGKILIDTFSNNQEIRRGFFNDHMDPLNGDQYVQMVNDSILIFSSNRKDGYGGLDIYYTKKLNDVWEEPINLGPEINGPFDEIAPFLTLNGQKLFFSSNRPEGIGGFDIYQSEFSNETGVWNTVVNANIPVNSAADDLNFRIAPSGNEAVFSSNRKSSYGGYDLFNLYFKDSYRTFMEMAEAHPAFDQWSIAKDSNSMDERLVLIDAEVPHLLYGQDDIILSAQNLRKLSIVEELLKNDPDLNIDVLGFTDNSQNAEYDLFFSIKRAEKVKDYFINKGISSDRIFIVGFGKAFPRAINEINGVANPSGQKFNRRIEFKIHQPIEKYNLKYQFPKIVKQFQDSSYTRLAKFRDGLTYKIFVASSNLPNIPDKIKNYSYLMIEKIDGSGEYDYTIGLETTFTEAQTLKQKVRKEGLMDASIYAYINGRRISSDEIEDLTAQYPDLIFYQFRSE